MHKKTHMPSRRSPQKPPADYKETSTGQKSTTTTSNCCSKKRKKKKKKMEERKETSPAWMPSCTFKDFQRFPETIGELFVRRETGKEETRSAAKEDEAKVQGLNLPPLTPFRSSLG
jgi:hypothetical protein